jgi:hypothetical protein
LLGSDVALPPLGRLRPGRLPPSSGPIDAALGLYLTVCSFLCSSLVQLAAPELFGNSFLDLTIICYQSHVAGIEYIFYPSISTSNQSNANHLMYPCTAISIANNTVENICFFLQSCKILCAINYIRFFFHISISIPTY